LRGGVTRQHRPGRDLGVESIGLALASTLVTIGLVDLDHVQASLA
jgi:hypothetical protein